MKVAGARTSVDPSQAQGRDVSVREALDAAAVRIDAGEMAQQPEVETAVRKVVGGGGDNAAAEPLVREALAIRRQVLPVDHPQLAVGLNNLGFILWRKGELKEAESLYREALSIDRRALGGEHPEIPIKLLNLAVLYRDLGQPSDAEAIAREALEIRRKIFGGQHPDEALTIAARAYGEVNLNTARLQHNLGWALWKQGKYTDAAPLLRSANVNIPKTYGPTYRGARQHGQPDEAREAAAGRL